MDHSQMLVMYCVMYCHIQLLIIMLILLGVTFRLVSFTSDVFYKWDFIGQLQLCCPSLD